MSESFAVATSGVEMLRAFTSQINAERALLAKFDLNAYLMAGKSYFGVLIVNKD